MVAASVRAFLNSPKTNFWGAVVSAVAEIVGWIGNIPTEFPWWQPAAFGLTVFFMGRLAWTQYWEAEGYRKRLEPKFEIVFVPLNDEDSRPYLQTLEYPQIKQGGAVRRRVDRRYRVGLVNLSSGIVPDVSVVLARCTPAANFIHVGHKMLVMDTDPPRDTRDLPPSPTGEPTAYFDIVNENGPDDRVPDHFFFCYANPNIRGPIEFDIHRPLMTFEVVLRAEGGGYACERSFRVSKDVGARLGGWRRLEMRPL